MLLCQLVLLVEMEMKQDLLSFQKKKVLKMFTKTIYTQK